MNEIAETEAYLLNKLDDGEKLLVDAKLLVNPVFRGNLNLQKAIYRAIAFWSRKQLKKDLLRVQNDLLKHPEKKAFQEEIHHIFTEK